MITSNPVIPEAAAAVDVSGQTVDIAGQTVDISGQTVDIAGQTVDIENQTVDIAGQTVDIAGQTVDVAGQEVGAKVKASIAIGAEKKTVTAVAAKLFDAEPNGQRVTYVVMGKVWIGGSDLTKDNGFPVEEGARMEWHTSAALYAMADSTDVEVRVLKESF
ncbi:hypothetical protein [Pseudoteredinibacter isoporae]|uniref:hypothetical protein n=1 Tax=Pseudoteredinibacter isoporae TaxID=570281 RepID=UPI003109985B